MHFFAPERRNRSRPCAWPAPGGLPVYPADGSRAGRRSLSSFLHTFCSGGAPSCDASETAPGHGGEIHLILVSALFRLRSLARPTAPGAACAPLRCHPLPRAPSPMSGGLHELGRFPPMSCRTEKKAPSDSRLRPPRYARASGRGFGNSLRTSPRRGIAAAQVRLPGTLPPRRPEMPVLFVLSGTCENRPI